MKPTSSIPAYEWAVMLSAIEWPGIETGYVESRRAPRR